MKLLKVAVYLRVSSKDQDVEIQKEKCLAYCKMKGWDDVKIYIDKCSGDYAEQSALNRLLSDGMTDVLVFWRFDRFSRSLKDLIVTLDNLSSRGIKVVSVSEGFDTTTINGRLMVHIIGAFAQFEREMIVERTTMGRKRAEDKGIKFGRKPKICLDSVKDLRSSGLSFQKIADKLGFSKSAIYEAYHRSS